MKSSIVWPWELPEKLPKNSLVVVADVYAATSNISLFLAKGVKRLLIVNEHNVVSAKKQYKDALVIGESLLLPRDFFIAPNNPSIHQNIDFKNKTVLYMSNMGVKAIESVLNKGVQEVIVASYLNLNASVTYLLQTKQKKIIFVPAGDFTLSGKNALEDMMCVKSLNDSIQNKKINLKEVVRKTEEFILSHYHGERVKFDVDIILNVDKYNTVPICRKEENGLIEVLVQ